MAELRDSATGNVITPEMITAQLQESGIGDIGDEVKRVPEKAADESPKDEAKKEDQTVSKVADVDDIEVIVDDVKDESKLSDIEHKAKEKGWNPDGEKSAEEFLRAEPLYDEIKARGKEIKELKQTLDELKGHMDKQQELGYQKALHELKAQRVDAIEMGDVKNVNELDQQIKEYEQNLNVQPAVLPEVAAFQDRNKEWIEDPSYEAQQIREFAHQRDQELAQFNLPPEEHLKMIESDIRKKFKSRYASDEGSRKGMAVETDAAPAKPVHKKRYKFSDLNAEQKKCARHFEKRGIMKVEDYIKSLVDLGEI